MSTFLHDPVLISRGVWLPAATAAEPVARLAALLTVLPAGSAFSGRTAAGLHGLWVAAGPTVDVTVPAGARPELVTGPRRRGVRTHRRALAPTEVVRVAGLPATSVARTWHDLAAELSLPDLVAAGDCALRAGLVRPGELAGGLPGRRGRPGVTRARRALPLLDGASRSRPESHARVILALAGLPAPAVNVAVLDDVGQWVAEPDLSYAEARVAIEYQGAHHAEAGQMRRDVSRHMDLRRAGWDVLYYTAEQVFAHPDVLVADVRTALATRAPHLLARGVAEHRRLTTHAAGWAVNPPTAQSGPPAERSGPPTAQSGPLSDGANRSAGVRTSHPRGRRRAARRRRREW